MSATGLSLPRSGLATGCRSFLSWWLAELKAMLPAWLSASDSTHARMLLVCPEESGVRLLVREAGKIKELGAWRSEEAAGAFERVRAARRYRQAKVALVIARQSGLRREARLPLATRNDLRQVLGHQMARLTPYSKQEVNFGFVVRAEDYRSAQLIAEISVVPIDEVERGLDLLERWGLQADAAFLAPEDMESAFEPNLLVTKDHPRRLGVARILAATLVLLNLLLLSLIFGLPLADRMRAEDLLRRQLDAEMVKAEIIDRLRGQTEALEAEVAVLPAMVDAVPSKLMLIEELTALIPDGAWLESLMMSSLEVRLRGHARSAADLVKHLEESPRFINVRYRAPVLPDRNSGLEKFYLSAEIKVESDQQ